MTIVTLADGSTPTLADDAFVAAGAVLSGRVRLDAGSSVWYNAVLRAEAEEIVLGARSNIQDNVSCHVDHGYPLTIGADVNVGHNAVLHGCTIEDGVLVGMHATVLNGAVVGAGSLLAAGTVVLEGAVIPPGSLVAGVPGKVRRELTEDERAAIRQNAEAYLRHIGEHPAAV
ncbi:gamma carbonic anhydrase family protein [Leifsonia xyli subsp. xyli]|uniref:Siderophore binding protein n=2 Tax=Leifsonia xyli subsp. xyli TaxID=59736 RepID=Q6ADF3_LEIXX|nr:gamma carbonic anhydrase family protein [Leifsonia xyli]AAT89592.1 siderophore binding protein [Leifsonia xyli subsp. xyli str. CTCB07]ODA91296.1 gamma carbonic anhydrase family protein [Leifsonia xyli subsp. xyli]